MGTVSMGIQHDDLVWLAKSVGLFLMLGLSLIIVIYVYWPSNKKRFDQAARSILRDQDRP